MMFHYPYFGFPYYQRYSRYGYRYPSSYAYSSSTKKDRKERDHIEKKSQNTVHTNKKPNPPFDHIKKEECSSNGEDSPLFQIFGIILYFDDILLICLIFFLYQEGVEDDSLFLALILLLLS